MTIPPISLWDKAAIESSLRAIAEHHSSPSLVFEGYKSEIIGAKNMFEERVYDCEELYIPTPEISDQKAFLLEQSDIILRAWHDEIFRLKSSVNSIITEVFYRRTPFPKSGFVGRVAKRRRN